MPSGGIGFGFTPFLCALASTALPSFLSFRAIESPRREDDVQWLTYWVVLAVVQLLEFWFEWLMQYFPLYYELKLMFILWLWIPGWLSGDWNAAGATVMYRRYVAPWMTHGSDELRRQVAYRVEMQYNGLRDVFYERVRDIMLQAARDATAGVQPNPAPSEGEGDAPLPSLDGRGTDEVDRRIQAAVLELHNSVLRSHSTFSEDLRASLPNGLNLPDPVEDLVVDTILSELTTELQQQSSNKKNN